jgi:hypothetical protein
MTVSELIRRLQECDPSAEIAVEHSREAGLSDAGDTLFESFSGTVTHVADLQTRIVLDVN